MENTSTNPRDNTNTSNEPTLESLEETMGPPPTGQPTEQPIEPISPLAPALKPRKSKTRLVLTLLAVFVLIGAAAAYWFVLRPDDETVTTPRQLAAEPAGQQAPLKPATIAYSYKETVEGETEDCGPNNRSSRLYTRPVTGGERVEAGDALANAVFTGYDVRQNHVVAVTSASCGGGGETIWYSSDAGKSYTAVYTGQKATREDGLPEQITSIKLASDSKSLVFGSLGSTEPYKNTIKELDLASKTVKDIKAIDVAGVFLEGYDKSRQTLYYYTGCFQCDGVSRDKLLALNTSTAAESTLVDQTKDGTAGLDAVFNDDFSKLLTVRGTTSPDSMGAGAPYTIQEYHVQQKTTQTIATIAAEQHPLSIGYTVDNQLPYYAEGKNVYTIGVDGKSTVVFEATSPIYGVYYVGKDYVVASAGTYENFTLVTYDSAAKKATTILTGDAQSTQIFGVGHQ
ncbi:hypothetical protein E6P97_03050 [Patescibacteria group bacterium]|nr:MAG: hypothetical protein E6P97_03050 [Patescibacteria group bacterium]